MFGLLWPFEYWIGISTIIGTLWIIALVKEAISDWRDWKNPPPPFEFHTYGGKHRKGRAK